MFILCYTYITLVDEKHAPPTLRHCGAIAILKIVADNNLASASTKAMSIGIRVSRLYSHPRTLLRHVFTLVCHVCTLGFKICKTLRTPHP